MTKRTKDDWRELIEQQIASNLSVAEFCKQHSLAQTYFYKRKSDLKKLAKKPQASSFIKVSKPLVNDYQNVSIKVQHKQSQLSLPVSVSPSWLAEFIKALA